MITTHDDYPKYFDFFWCFTFSVVVIVCYYYIQSKDTNKCPFFVPPTKPFLFSWHLSHRKFIRSFSVALSFTSSHTNWLHWVTEWPFNANGLQIVTNKNSFFRELSRINQLSIEEMILWTLMIFFFCSSKGIDMWCWLNWRLT